MVFLIILVLAFLLQMIMPWWVVIVISFVTCAVLSKTAKIALWSPFFAILLLWTVVALLKSVPNNHLMVSRVAEMLSLSSWWLVLVITALLGAFVAAVSGFCGYHFRKAMFLRKSAS
jgi:hypothetical protein